MSTFDRMQEITGLVAMRDAISNSIQQACSKFVCSVVVDVRPNSTASFVILEWEETSDLISFIAYDEDYEPVPLFADHKAFCENNSIYLLPLYRPFEVCAIDLKSGSIGYYQDADDAADDLTSNKS